MKSRKFGALSIVNTNEILNIKTRLRFLEMKHFYMELLLSEISIYNISFELYNKLSHRNEATENHNQ